MERQFTFRAFLVSITGVCVIYIYLCAGYYLVDRMENLSGIVEQINYQLRIDDLDSSMLSFAFISSVLIGVVSAFRLLQKASFSTVYKRKKHYLFLILLFYLLAFAFVFPAPYALFIEPCIMILTIILCLSLLYQKKKWIYELIFVSLFLVALYLNFR
jgi:hypothetical protein